MKKNFKFMLTALLATFGFSNASAQDLAKGGTVRDQYYQYELVTAPVAVEGQDDAYTANVALIAINNGKNPVVGGAIYMPENGIITTTLGSETYTLTLTQIGKEDDPATEDDETIFSPLRNLDLATSVTIPATLKAIPEACFEGCSAMTSIVFAEGSQVETIGSHAFATTKITDFNFSPCKKLAGLPDEVFVQEGLDNTYITNVTVPGEDNPLFKHINGAFQNLRALETITGLENSFIEEVIEEAFLNCDKLETLSLPGNNLRFVDKAAFKGSSIKTLSIDVSSIEFLGGCTQNAETGEFEEAEAETNLYGQEEIGETPLESLTLTGTLTGIIATNSFAWCDKLDEVLDFTDMTLGSTGQFQEGAFKECYNGDLDEPTGIRGVRIKDIITNTLADDGYTIDGGVFEGCELLSLVEIESINTENAIGPAAFGEKLKTVKIGTIKAGAEALAGAGEETKGAFVWDNVPGAELELAQVEGSYLFANDVNSPIIGEGAFDMSAIVATEATAENFVWPTITIGEIRSKGGVFDEGAILPPAKIKEMTFNGEIAANGLDQAIIATDDEAEEGYDGLDAITFTGKINRGGIATGVFANVSSITTLNFSGLLAENAVKTGAFAFPVCESADDIPEGTNYALNYTCTNIRDWTVNPFEKGALNADADVDDYRYVQMNGDLFDALKANYEDEVKGLGTNGQFDIYLVKFEETEDVYATTFLLYQNGSTTNAWGRYDLGSFTVEKGEKYKVGATQEEIEANPELAGYQAADMVIERYQVVQNGAATVKLTIYGMYGDSNENPLAGGDDTQGESLVYMVPLQVINGKYYISSENLKTLIIKAEAIKGAFNNKKVPVAYTEWEAPEADEPEPGQDEPGQIEPVEMPNSVWEALPDFGEERAFDKNDDVNPVTGTVDVITTQILWDRTNEEYDVWGSEAAVDHDLQYAPYAVYSISNPANYQGVQVIKLLVSKTSGKIGANWYYMLMPHFKKAGDDEAQAARIVWLDETQATAIFGVKELKAKANAKNGVIYNLQGVRVNTPSKGLYIMDGKKYIVK